MKYLRPILCAALLAAACCVPDRRERTVRMPEQPAPERIRLLFGGDVMQHLPQIQSARRNGGFDYGEVFAALEPRFRAADLVVVNLETTLADAEPYAGYPVFRSPAALADALHEAGVDIAVLANNHCCDGGLQGIRTTVRELERCGIRVVLTRTDEHCPTGKADTNDLLKRVAISDAAGADLFVSLHSNASGNEWSNASGLMIYTSAGPETASRNVAAKAVLSRMTEAGVELRGSPLVHDMELVVTRKTAAPAMLIEYGFHTNRTEVALLKNGSYRAKLAEATAKGACDFLGVAWEPEAAAGTTDTGAADWAATAWEKAKSKGVLDGTRPTDPVTRQELAVVLDRLNLI